VFHCILTWLNSHIARNSISLDNFKTPFRRDSLDTQDGGVAVYIEKHIHADQRHDFEVRGLENVWIEIRVKNNTPVLIGTFYRPLNSPLNIFDLIELSIDLAVDTGVDTILFVS